MRVPLKGLDKSWRFEKTDKPDPGSYEHAEATLLHSSTIKRPPSVKFSQKVNHRYTTLIANSKMYIPPPGNYEVEKCFKKLSRPPSALRSRR